MLVTLFILAGSAIAITLLVVLNAKLGGWTPSRIESLEMAGAKLCDDHLTFVPGDGVLSMDGLASLMASTSQDSVGVVAARGAGFVTRLITHGDQIRTVEPRGDGALTLTFRGDTIRPVTLTLETAQDAHDWARRLNELGG